MPILLPDHKDLALLRQRLTDRNTYATTLLAIAIDRYGDEVLTWTPDTIRYELEIDFGIKLPQLNLDKIMAAILIQTTDYFYRSTWYFVQLCNVLSGSLFDPEEFDMADSYEIALGLTEALLISPPDKDEEPFDDQVRWYIGFVLDYEGIDDPPDVLRLALREGSTPTEIFDGLPDSYELYAAKRDADREGLQEAIADKMNDLFNQLETTPFETVKGTELVQKLRKGLR